MTRAALQNLQPGGRLVLLASRVAEHGGSGQTAYAASKAAVIGLARCAAREAAERRIMVNVVCPGFVPSPLGAALTARQRDRARQASVLEEFGTAEQAAATVAWLLSDAALGITGQVIHCDSRI